MLIFENCKIFISKQR